MDARTRRRSRQMAKAGEGVYAKKEFGMLGKSKEKKKDPKKEKTKKEKPKEKKVKYWATPLEDR